MDRSEAPLLRDALVAASGATPHDQLVGLAVLALAEAIHRLADVHLQCSAPQATREGEPAR